MSLTWVKLKLGDTTGNIVQVFFTGHLLRTDVDVGALPERPLAGESDCQGARVFTDDVL